MWSKYIFFFQWTEIDNRVATKEFEPQARKLSWMQIFSEQMLVLIPFKNNSKLCFTSNAVDKKFPVEKKTKRFYRSFQNLLKKIIWEMIWPRVFRLSGWEQVKVEAVWVVQSRLCVKGLGSVECEKNAVEIL